MELWAGVIIAYHLTSRLAYVVWVGTALTQQDRHQLFTRDEGVVAGFQRFRRRASRLMANDAASFVLLCVATRGGLHTGIPQGIVFALSGLLVVAGIGTKVWAANTLGRKAYYWHNFFAPDNPPRRGPSGPYRYLNNPMYTVGYLQVYGLALALGSLPGLVMALVDQVAILIFHHCVEKPHYQTLCATAASPAPASPSRAP
jgi:protein-S-isoprenylcysteine O-methyltransferase Ste14